MYSGKHQGLSKNILHLGFRTLKSTLHLDVRPYLSIFSNLYLAVIVSVHNVIYYLDFNVKSGKCLNSPSLISPSSRGIVKNKKHSYFNGLVYIGSHMLQQGHQLGQ